MWNLWLKAGRPTDRLSISRLLGAMAGGNQKVLGAWRKNVYRALQEPDAQAITLSGPKVSSFMRNLLGDSKEVTLDAWMKTFAGINDRIFDGVLNAAGTDPGKSAGYLAFSSKIRATAERLTAETGEEWTPAEVQETIWSWTKTLVELGDAAGETRSLEELVKEGVVSDELIAEVPDFGKLFTGEKEIRWRYRRRRT